MAATQIKPITGILRRNLILDLGIALGIGFTFGSAYWYGHRYIPLARTLVTRTAVL
ncbi:hypothetical protein CONLIGDRAFT_633426 [Coniochaeta ligniaria NRRL 30616]|uniref:Uncharacterized protein n=1 Tax=Coniochaeta ligniaria NRRL 30616 TaxID=1408157 RepID=A0A1J7IPH9_9PEZI|nr:hypothetical protein CONLIGDRAFT_633426 [Coniochaeta ligniaria NRRL 30616]